MATLLSPALGSRPSYKQGFARSRGESGYPKLWDGLAVAYCPALGEFGGTLSELSGRAKKRGTIVGATWIHHPLHGYGLNGDGANDEVTTGVSIPASTRWTIAHAAISDSLGQSNFGILWGINGTAVSYLVHQSATTMRPFLEGVSRGDWTTVWQTDGTYATHVLRGTGSNTIIHENGAQVVSSPHVDLTTGEVKLLDRTAQDLTWDGPLFIWLFYNKDKGPNFPMVFHQDPLALFRLNRPILGNAEVAAAAGNPWYHNLQQMAGAA